MYIFRTIMNFVNGFIASMLFIRPTMHRYTMSITCCNAFSV